MGYCADWANHKTKQYQATFAADVFGPPDYQVDWVRYVEKVMKALKGKVTQYEVWNEPDGKYLCGTTSVKDNEYTENYWIDHRLTSLILGVRKAADRVDTDNDIIAPTWNHDYHGTRMKRLFNLGMDNLIDRYSFHLYPGWNFGKWEYWFKSKYIKYIQSELDNRSINMPLSITEVGWPGAGAGTYDPDPNNGDGFIGYTDQARAFWKIFMCMLCEEKLGHIIQFSDFVNNSYAGYFSLYKFGDPERPKQGYYAMKSIAKRFSDKTVKVYNSAQLINEDENTFFYPLVVEDTGDIYLGLWQAKWDESASTKYFTLSEKTVKVQLPEAPGGYKWQINRIDAQGHEEYQSYTATSGGIEWSVTLSANTLMEESMPNLFVARLVDETNNSTNPLNLSMEILSDSKVILDWNVPVDNVRVAGYNIYRNGSYIGQSNKNSFVDQDLYPETEYSYYVRSIDSSGSEISARSNIVSGTTGSSIFVYNSDFESGGSQPDYWTYETWNGNSEFGWVSNYVYSGSKSIKIENDSNDDHGLWIQRNKMAQVSPRKTQIFTVWTKTYNVSASAGDGAKIDIMYYDSDGNIINKKASSFYLTGTNDWTKLGVMSTAPLNAAYVRLSLVLLGKGKAWFDHISAYEFNNITRVEIIPPYSDDFESGIDSWSQVISVDPGDVEFSKSIERSYSGSTSLKIYWPSGWGIASWARVNKDRITVEGGKSYTVSVWTYNEWADSRIGLGWYDTQGNLLGNIIETAEHKNVRQWEKISLTETAPLDAVTLRVDLRKKGSGSAWFDYFSIEEAKCPDLVIKNIKTSPVEPVSGDMVTFSAEIENIGTSNVENSFITTFTVNGGTTEYSAEYNNTIAVGETVTVTSSTKWQAMEGENTINALVDNGDQITESDENNNTSSLLNRLSPFFIYQ